MLILTGLPRLSMGDEPLIAELGACFFRNISRDPGPTVDKKIVTVYGNIHTGDIVSVKYLPGYSVYRATGRYVSGVLTQTQFRGKRPGGYFDQIIELDCNQIASWISCRGILRRTVENQSIEEQVECFDMDTYQP